LDFFYSDSGRHVVPLEHNILIGANQSLFLLLNTVCCVLVEKQ